MSKLPTLPPMTDAERVDQLRMDLKQALSFLGAALMNLRDGDLKLTRRLLQKGYSETDRAIDADFEAGHAARRTPPVAAPAAPKQAPPLASAFADGLLATFWNRLLDQKHMYISAGLRPPKFSNPGVTIHPITCRARVAQRIVDLPLGVRFEPVSRQQDPDQSADHQDDAELITAATSSAPAPSPQHQRPERAHPQVRVIERSKELEEELPDFSDEELRDLGKALNEAIQKSFPDRKQR